MKAIRIFTYAGLSLMTVAARPADIQKPLAGEFSVRPDRPRLYLNAADLDKVRIRIASTHQDEWRSVLRARESQDLSQRMLACAFSFQVNRDGPEARRAISAALELAGQDLDQVDDDLRLAYRVWPESVVYDWCHDQFTAEERQLLLTRVRAQLEIAGGGRILETQPQRLSAFRASDSRNVPETVLLSGSRARARMVSHTSASPMNYAEAALPLKRVTNSSETNAS